MTILLLIVCIFFLALGVPTSFGLGLGFAIFTFVWGGVSIDLLFQEIYKASGSFPLMAIPFFILAGELMIEGKIMPFMLEFINYFVGGIRGGLAHVNIVASAFFAGISGSAVSDTAAIGSITIPAMKQSGYRIDFAVALSAAAGVMGPIIPPSILAVIYSSIYPVSVGALFAGGMIPGILIAVALMLVVGVQSVKYDFPKSSEKFEPKKVFISFIKTFPALLMPIIVLGGILFGVFTPTEASATAAAYALIVGIFIYRTLTIRIIFDCFLRASITSSTILLIIGTCDPFGWVMAFLRIPQTISNFVIETTSNPAVVVLLFMVFLLFMVCIMDAAVSVLIFGPTLAAVAAKFGIDPLHFGVLYVINVCIGIATPPRSVCAFLWQRPLEEFL